MDTNKGESWKRNFQHQPVVGIREIAQESRKECRRWDLPVQKPTARGSRHALFAVAACPAKQQQAVKKLRSHMYARTTVGPKRSRLRTAERLARKQGIISIYPLQSHTLERVAASFMHAGYRTTPKYLTELKVRNTELGFEWSAQLDLTMHRCCAATQRGIGPPRKAGEIHLAVAAKMCEGQTPSVRGGPEFAKRSWLISVFWVLREIDQANIRLHSSHVVIGGAWARLVLPVSKTDPGVVGRARTF